MQYFKIYKLYYISDFLRFCCFNADIGYSYSFILLYGFECDFLFDQWQYFVK